MKVLAAVDLGWALALGPPFKVLQMIIKLYKSLEELAIQLQFTSC